MLFGDKWSKQTQLTVGYGRCCFVNNRETLLKAATCGAQQQKEVFQDKTRAQDQGRNIDICGICPSEVTSVSVNEPWQVLTMHAAGS